MAFKFLGLYKTINPLYFYKINFKSANREFGINFMEVYGLFYLIK